MPSGSVHPEFGPIAIISAISLLLPLPWHWRAGNAATLAIIAWLFVSNIIYAVDALVWGNNVDITAQVWCDITTKLLIGANFALPTACLCICIHLEQVASGRFTQSTLSDRRRRQCFEIGMCVGLPLVFMILHYIVQGHRYDIIEGYGCRPATYFSIPALFIVWIPPVIMSCIAIIFAGISLRHFIRRRLSFAAHLSSSNSALTPSRYIRLMTMAALQMVWSISATVYALIFMFVSGSLRPWTTWADVHSDWIRVDVFPDAFAPPFVRRAFYVLWWIIPISTFLFVVFFSFGKDATDEYKKCCNWVCTKVFRQDSSTSGKSKKTRFSISMTRFKSLRGLLISNPTSLPSNMTESTPPSYDASTSTCTPEKLWHELDDKVSQVSQDVEIACPQSQSKAMSSYSDFSLRTPSTIIGSSPADKLPELTLGLSAETQMPPTPPPLTPPPRNPRLRPPQLLARSSPASRPLTYPSFEAAQRSVNAESA